MAKITDYTKIPEGTRKSSTIRKAWGTPPPENQPRTPYEFWDGAQIPGGINPTITNAVKHLDQAFQNHEYQIAGNETDDWCYNRRRTKYGRVWSLHSWAIALDINALENPYSKRFVTDMTPQLIADIQAIRTPKGVPVWAWGGQWGRMTGYSYDPMHFQINLTPAEARALGPPAPIYNPDAADRPDELELSDNLLALRARVAELESVTNQQQNYLREYGQAIVELRGMWES